MSLETIINDVRGDATTSTELLHGEFSSALPWSDDQDFRSVDRGFIGTLSDPRIHNSDGQIVMDLTSSEFLQADAPATANASLWRMAQLNSRHGLFKVCDRVYQVRNFDISNLTVIIGDEGFIVVDPLYSEETAAAAMQLVREHLGDRPVTGMIYTHAHLDHFGGSRGVVTAEEVLKRSIPVVAPEGFMEHAINENLFAGVAEARRNQFMFGAVLPQDPKGQITSSLGIGISKGVSTLVAPTVGIGAQNAEMTIDGVRFRFHPASGGESPAEFHFTLPDLGAACLAENLNRLMHNIYTLRGAPVRDALLWSKIIDSCFDYLDDGVDVVFMGHHWPVWGAEEIRHFLGKQRDLYRFMHDETLRLINHGYTGHEISEVLQLPDGLANYWPSRGLYGSLSHNVKAIYQRYMGWFDANPANLNPLPPGPAGRKYVQAMGGEEAVLTLARTSFEQGDYRWVSELLKHLLAAAPDRQEARELQAASFEQMGYQAESGPWRNFYLSGAQELRGTEKQAPGGAAERGNELVAAMGLDPLLDYLAIRFNGSTMQHLSLTMQFAIDGQTRYVVISDGTLRSCENLRRWETADAEITLPRTTFVDLCRGTLSWRSALSTETKVSGDSVAVEEFWSALDTFTGAFVLTTPHI